MRLQAVVRVRLGPTRALSTFPKAPKRPSSSSSSSWLCLAVSLCSTSFQTSADSSVVGSALLFYLAKKRQWEVRKSLRRSARRLTGSFKTSGQTSSRKQRGLSRITESPPPPLSRKQDIEKGTTTTITSTFEVESPTPRSWRQTLSFWKKPSR